MKVKATPNVSVGKRFEVDDVPTAYLEFTTGYSIQTHQFPWSRPDYALLIKLIPDEPNKDGNVNLTAEAYDSQLQHKTEGYDNEAVTTYYLEDGHYSGYNNIFFAVKSQQLYTYEDRASFIADILDISCDEAQRRIDEAEQAVSAEKMEPFIYLLFLFFFLTGIVLSVDKHLLKNKENTDEPTGIGAVSLNYQKIKDPALFVYFLPKNVDF